MAAAADDDLILVADDDEHIVDLVSMYLRRAGYRVEARPPEIDETPRPGERPWELVVRLARGKCAAVAFS